MNDFIDAYLFDAPLSADQQETLRQAVADDPDLAAALQRWEAVRQAIRARLPERRLLVCRALQARGYDVALTDDERAALEEARAHLERALAEQPGTHDVADAIDDAIDDFEACWQQYLEAPAVRETSPVRPAAAPRGAPRRTVPLRRWVWRATAVAAVLAFAVLLSTLWQRDAAYTTRTVADGATEVVTLIDGTTVRLVGPAELAYAEPEAATALNRRVRLDGQAFFDVVPSEVPFVVETSTALTTVLGTSFGVQATEALTEVVLVSGRVTLASKAAPSQPVALEPGQASRVAANALPATPAPADVTEALDWTGLLLFRATSLATIAERLSARYDVSVEVAAALADEPVTGTFRPEQPLDEVLQALAATLAAEVQPTDTGYRLAPAR